MKKGKQQFDVQLIGLIVSAIARKNPFFNELVVSFTNRKADVLEAILREVFGSGSRNSPISSAQISALFYLINTNKPFTSGNRRIALAVLFYLLAQEGKWLKADNAEVYNLAQWVALSPADAKAEVVGYIEKFIKKHEVKISEERRKK